MIWRFIARQPQECDTVGHLRRRGEFATSILDSSSGIAFSGISALTFSRPFRSAPSQLEVDPSSSPAYPSARTFSGPSNVYSHCKGQADAKPSATSHLSIPHNRSGRIQRVTDHVGCATHARTELRSRGGESGSKDARVRVPTRPSIRSTRITAVRGACTPSVFWRTGPRGGIVYDNGPIDGNTYAWEIDSYNGLYNVVSNTFTLTGSSTITGISFGTWLFPGDTLYSVQIIISSQPNNGGTIYYNSPSLSLEPSGCVLNQYGFNVCTETVVSYLSIPELSPGTYWINLENAAVSNFDPAFWDQNSGVGCMSPGCPSQAQSYYYGPIPSESFTLTGNGSPPPQCVQPQGNLHVLYNFTQQQAGTSGQDGVVIDRGGNLYGAFPNGGDHGAGLSSS